MSSATQPHRQGPQAEVTERRDIKVLAVDDHQAFRDVLRDLILATPGFVLVGEAGSGEEALHAFDAADPELVLMDVAMPGIGGVAAARSILSRRLDVLVVLISIDDPALSQGVAVLGDAVGCVRKQDLRPQQLQRLWASHRRRARGVEAQGQRSCRASAARGIWMSASKFAPACLLVWSMVASNACRVVVAPYDD